MRRSQDTSGGLVDDLVRQIATSAKYQSLDPAFVRRVVERGVDRCRDRNQALKYARRKLHQAYGAFAARTPASAVRAFGRACREPGADVRAAALIAMRAHASAAERIAWLEPFYAQVAAWCGEPGSVADLACGLNPLAIAWMRLPPHARYWCCDVDTELSSALTEVADLFPVRLTATTCDLTAPAPIRAATALLLKTFTTVEQQVAGASREILLNLTCDHVIVTLPRRSLSGGRGYQDDPYAMIDAAIAGTRYQLADEAAFGTESVFHLTPAAPSS
ncbi:MAG TPA: hypothetical protein VF163_22910 [Micromonosporaceae bacterium]